MDSNEGEEMKDEEKRTEEIPDEEDVEEK